MNTTVKHKTISELPGGTTIVEFNNGYGLNLFNDRCNGWIELVSPSDSTIYEQEIAIVQNSWKEKDIVRAAILAAIDSLCSQIWDLPKGQGHGDDPSYNSRNSKFCTIEDLLKMIDSDRFDSADFELYYELDSFHEKELHLTVKD
jgi:hypothetical protein